MAGMAGMAGVAGMAVGLVKWNKVGSGMALARRAARVGPGGLPHRIARYHSIGLTDHGETGMTRTLEKCRRPYAKRPIIHRGIPKSGGYPSCLGIGALSRFPELGVPWSVKNFLHFSD